MGFLIARWRGIGTRLYLALGFAVILTLVSAGVGVFYFERSGDLNYKAESEAVPVLEAAWEASREAERLKGLGLELQSASSPSEFRSEAVDETIGSLEAALTTTSTVQALTADAQAVQAAGYGVAEAIDGLALNLANRTQAAESVAVLRQRMSAIPADTGSSVAALRLLGQALRAEDQAALDGMWEEFTALSQSGLVEPIADVGGGQGVFATRGQQLALIDQNQDLAASFNAAAATLEASAAVLLEGARQHSSETLGLAVESFDQGRILLAVISVVSVLVATLAAWLWVGNAVVRRLSALSERMRLMARGDLETPVPEVGRDEIGQLAEALEHFRQQALEVQRLNLIERLYGELQDANMELQRMQARLVAQEKLAALGELVSGVAHEISNPLNFVKNFSEGSLDLYNELSEMLDTYRDQLSDADASLLDELSGEITESLGRVSYNGGRALAIVERMRGLSAEGGTPVLTDLNAVLRQAVQQGCETFEFEFDDFHLELEFDLDQSVGEQMVAERDFGEAIVNLVSNACFAMQTKRGEDGETSETSETGDKYQPRLTVSSLLTEGLVEVRVRDNGPGISEENASRIFNPFFSTRDGALGAGLGLPIAADVARRMGGDLVADSVHGEYAEFTMHIPAVVEEEETVDGSAQDIAGIVKRMSTQP